jgi:hypothetical protein
VALLSTNDGVDGCASGASDVAVWAGGSVGTVTVISSAESGNANALPAKNSTARYPLSLDTAALPRQKISHFLSISSRDDLRQTTLSRHFYVYGIDAMRNGNAAYLTCGFCNE